MPCSSTSRSGSSPCAARRACRSFAEITRFLLARFADVGVRREHFPGALVGLVVLTVMQLFERQAVHVEVDERRLDGDRVQVLGHEGYGGGLAHHPLARL